MMNRFFVGLLSLCLAVFPALAGSISIPFPGPGGGAGTIPIGTPVSIGSNEQSTISSLTMTTSGAIPAGSLALVFIEINKSTAISVSSVSDGTNSYTLARTSTWDVNTFVTYEIWYKANASAVGSGATITATLSATAGNTNLIAAAYVTGVLTSSPLDKVNSGTTGCSGLSPNSGSTGTLTIANEIVFGGTGGYVSPVTAAVISVESSGFTQLHNVVGSSTRFLNHTAYRIVNATTAQTYNPTVGGSATASCFGTVIASFKGN